MRRVILAAIAFLIAGSAAVAAADVDGLYLADPLRQGAVTVWARVCADPSDFMTCVGGGRPGRGDTFLVGMAVVNAGRLPVTITDIPVSEGPVVTLDQVRLGNDWPAVTLQNTSPFAPFTLQSKQERMVYLIWHSTPCVIEPGDSITVSRFTVRYRWLFTEHEQRVKMPGVRLGAGASC